GYVRYDNDLNGPRAKSGRSSIYSYMCVTSGSEASLSEFGKKQLRSVGDVDRNVKPPGETVANSRQHIILAGMGSGFHKAQLCFIAVTEIFQHRIITAINTVSSYASLSEYQCLLLLMNLVVAVKHSSMTILRNTVTSPNSNHDMNKQENANERKFFAHLTVVETNRSKVVKALIDSASLDVPRGKAPLLSGRDAEILGYLDIHADEIHSVNEVKTDKNSNVHNQKIQNEQLNHQNSECNA
ncbi:Hypothetical predicted protein, partial [Paramuricea clavata]